MNIQRQPSPLFLIMVTVAMLAAVTNLAAGPLKVNSADPAEGVQGETYDVTINGVGFRDAKQVRFLVTGTSETGNVGVPHINVVDDSTITANVVIADDATVADYDIEVQLRSGRKGKGTSKFSVQANGGGSLDIVDCSVFADVLACDCQFDKEGNIYRMRANCKTSETLVVPWGTLIRSEGPVQGSGEERKTLTAFAPSGDSFNGSSVIANAASRAAVSAFDIVIADSVAAGCGGSELQAAIRFVLDSTGPDGGAFPNPGMDPEPTSLLQALDMNISSDYDPLCNAIEIYRTPAYTAAYTDKTDELPAVDWKVKAEGNLISDGSYEKTAILYWGVLKWGDNFLNPPQVSFNVIGAPACVDEGDASGADDAVAIDYGPMFHLDPNVMAEGIIESNTIDMEAGCDSGKVPVPNRIGVRVIGDSGSAQTTVNVTKNDISGTTVAVLLEDDVVYANFSGNTFTGDGDPVAICSIEGEGAVGERGKPNKISGFDSDYGYDLVACGLAE